MCARFAHLLKLWLALQRSFTGRNGHMQPRVAFLKLDEDLLSSDSEDRLTLKLQPSDAMPLIVAGKLSNLCSSISMYTLIGCPAVRNE